jgi:hypothetical protein
MTPHMHFVTCQQHVVQPHLRKSVDQWHQEEAAKTLQVRQGIKTVIAIAMLMEDRYSVWNITDQVTAHTDMFHFVCPGGGRHQQLLCTSKNCITCIKHEAVTHQLNLSSTDCTIKSRMPSNTCMARTVVWGLVKLVQPKPV